MEQILSSQGYKCVNGHVDFRHGNKNIFGTKVPKCLKCNALRPKTIEIFRCQLCHEIKEGEWTEQICETCRL